MKKKVLVVDNNPVFIKYMTTLLKKEGHEVLTAKDGLSALNVLKTYVPDIIFVDLVMPNITGEKLCPIIRSIPELKNTLLIVLSAIVAEENVDFKNFGADLCVAKGPFNKMAKHILDIIQRSDDGSLADISSNIIGLEDIHEREVTKELLSTKNHFELVLNNMTEGVIELTLDLDIVYVNPSAVSITGLLENKLLGLNFLELFHEEHREEIADVLELSDQKLKGHKRDSLVDLNGTKLILNVLKIEDGNNRSLFVILNDVSEQKRMEAQLQRANKMEAIGILAGGVAHDLNNILSGLVSYPELLLMDIPDGSPLKRPIQIIQKSGEKAAAAVQDLLTLARRGVATREVVHLNHIVHEYLKSPEYEKLKSFHPTVQLDHELDINLLNTMGSPIHLSKTVMNLVSNAAEAMQDGGKILVSTKNIYVDQPIRGYDDVDEGDYVLLSVSDTGVGISGADLERIFEPFYTKKVMGRSGTGLGMAVVWGTVKDHEGYIDIQSKVGEGTKFFLYFPVTRQELVKKILRSTIQDCVGNGEAIMVVDDVEEQREIATVILTKLGYQVTSASSGEEALDYLQSHSVALLVLDMIMAPGMDGLETYIKILEIHPEQKAVIASGFSETERVKNAQKLGAGTYLKKPYTIDKIGMAVRAELEKGK